MKYEDLIYYYEEELDYIKRHRDHQLTSKEVLTGRYLALRSIFRKLKNYECEDFPKIKNNKFNYRNFEVDVLADDPGQQLYIKLPNGKEIGGGTYNLSPEDIFSEAIDDYLDGELLSDLK